MIYYIARVKSISPTSTTYDQVNLYDVVYTYDRYEAAYEKFKQYRQANIRALDEPYKDIVMFSSSSKLYQICFIQDDLSKTGYNIWYSFTSGGQTYTPHWDLQPYEVAKSVVDYHNERYLTNANIPANEKIRAVMFPTV